MEHIHDIREELRQPAIELRHEIPEVFRAFGELSRSAMAEGEISSGFKE